MKKTLLTGLLVLAGLSANAQGNTIIPNGADAPNFTGTDVVTEAEVDLQAYLDEGKTVLVYMSAAWCGPCWQFHNTHILSDIHNAYGVDGSDEVVVIYIEADWRTPEGEIFGTDLPQEVPAGVPAPPPPLGNWTTDTPYIIINNDEVGEQYGIPGYPTMFAICPQGEGQPGKVYEIERGTPAELTTALETPCGVEFEGIDHWARVTGYDTRFCEDEGTIVAYVEGYGHELSSVTAQLKQGGEVIETKTFTLETEDFEVAEIEFDTALGEGGDYEVVLTDVNGAAPLTTIPELNTTGEYNLLPNAAIESSQNIFVVIHTDEYPEEMGWGLFNSAGELVLERYYDEAETTIEEQIVLEDVDCYDIVLIDGYGDGWVWNAEGGEVPHGITIYAGNSDEGTVLFQNDGDFGQRFDLAAAFTTNGTMGNEEFNDATFSIYPNPSNGTFNFTTEQVLDVTVLDITGKVVHTQAGITNGGVMNLGQLQAGVYIAKVKGENNAERIEKLVIK